MNRVLIYCHDTFGLGNVRRMLAIAKDLVDCDPETSVLVVSGSPMLHAFRIPPRVDYVKLPCLARTVQGEYKVKYLDLSYDRLITLRSNLILSAVLDFDPAVIIVDKKPFGVANELAPALELLRRRNRHPGMALLLRDILDHPDATTPVWRKNGYFDAVSEFYDQVLVVGSRDIFEAGKEYDFPPNARRKLRYCGYLGRERSKFDRKTLRARLGVGKDPLVLVTAGGGEDGYRVLSSYLAGLRASPPGEDVRSLLVCGPEMAKAQHQRILEDAASLPKVSVIEFSDDMMGLMEAADLVVSMSGYNTVCELLTLKKRAILVPRVRPVLEQWIRAERLARLGLMRAIHPDALTPEGLMGAVVEELGRTNVQASRFYQIDLNGLTRVSEAVGELLQERRPRIPLELAQAAASLP
ncbi:MAG: glycosyltransferase [Burkholderiales bacterium]